jgi:eukaryotic-like serine/threonine-protein kinase
MPRSKVVGGRYELEDPPIGQGGMGVVYRAYDSVTKRFVAIKTMWGSIDPAAVELFEKEWTVLARLCHPNIVGILDTGEFVDNGQHKPYFVMPFLDGATLDKLIKISGRRLEPERVVEIMAQACKALQAAHDRGLVHRDLKPSNIFVLDDDTVIIIDFGVVHLAGARTVTGIKGTLHYMAPEQLEMKPATPSSDIFSLGVVCYEALTGTKPFARETEAEMAEALRSYNPPPVSELNPAVSVPVSRAVHKAMAKQPVHRYASIKEFAETLRKAVRNEPIESFKPGKIQPRIDRIKKAFADGDYQFALEILCELESEGTIDPELPSMRSKIEQAMRAKTVRQFLDTARARMEEGEYDLALPKVVSVLEIEPGNVQAAAMKAQIERQKNVHQIEDWFRLAERHFDNQLFTQARQALDEILKIDGSSTRAREFVRRIHRRELEVSKLRKEQQQFYETALAHYKNGEISTALNKLERIIELQRSVSPNSQIDLQHQTLYQKILSERDKLEGAYTEGRNALAARDFAKALELCNEVLSKRPGEPMFQALKLEVEELRRQQKSGAIVRINAQVECEVDLDRKLDILKEAVDRYPDEQIFKHSLRLIAERRDLVHSIVSRARAYEEKSQFSEAVSQWDILRNIYPQFPGLDLEVQRLRRRREEQAREETKARLVEEIDRLMASGDYSKADQTAEEALEQFPDDGELVRLRKLAQNAERKSRQALVLYEEAQKLSAEGNDLAAIVKLRDAMQLDEKNSAIRAALQSGLVEYARGMAVDNWRAAAGFVEEALQIDDSDPVAKSLLAIVEDNRRRQSVDQYLIESRDLQAAGDLEGALEKARRGYKEHPGEIRLAQLHSRLSQAVDKKRAETGKRASVAAGERSVGGPAASAPDWDSPFGKRTAAWGRQAADSFGSSTATEVAGSTPPNQVRPLTPAPNVSRGFEARRGAGARSGDKRRRWPWWAGAAAVILIGTASAFRHFKVSTPLGEVSVTLSADAPAATFELDGKPLSGNQANVRSGAHRVSASANGFRAEEKILDVSAFATTPVSIPFHLVPLPPQIQILSDIRRGQAVLDGGVTDLQGGNFTRSDIAEGDHTLKVLQQGRQVIELNFNVTPGQAVRLYGPLTGATVPAMVVSSRANSAHVLATPGLLVNLAGHPPQTIPPAGSDFVLERGANEFVVSYGKAERHWNLEYTPGSALFVQLGFARETGTLMVKSNVPDAEVSISTPNGRPFLSGGLVNGVRILSLGPGKYQVKVSKGGYSELESQTAEVKEDERKEVSFDLTPVPVPAPAVTEVRLVLPAKADLRIDALPPGTEIYADNSRIGSATSDGTFEGPLKPGQHSFIFRKSGYEDFKITRNLELGSNAFSVADMAKGQLALLDVSVSPQDATILCRRDGDAAGQELSNGAKVALKPGTYNLTVTSEGYEAQTESVTLYPGKSNHVELALPAVKPAPVVATANSFEEPTSWTKADSGWYVHQSPTYTWFHKGDGVTHLYVYKPGRQPILGGLVNRAARIEWALDCKDNQRIEYSLDENQLRRTVVADGVPAKELKVPVAAGNEPYFQLDLSVTDAEVSVKIDGQTIDTVSRPDPGTPAGKVGFRGPVLLVIR